MGEECKMLMKHLAEKLAEKDVEGYPFASSWLRTRNSFEILKSVNSNIRGSRQPFFRSEVVDYFKVLNCTATDLFFLNNFIFVNPFVYRNFNILTE